MNTKQQKKKELQHKGRNDYTLKTEKTARGKKNCVILTFCTLDSKMLVKRLKY